MAKTKRQIIEELRLIDIVVELVDARIPIASRNPDMAEITKNKKRVIVLNKSDLSDKAKLNKWISYYQSKGIKAIPVDTLKGNGVNKIVEECKNATKEKMDALKEKGRKERAIRVMIVGVPNVGKSSLINGLMNRKSLARTSAQPGKTQTINFYNINEELYLVDLPGYGYAKVSEQEKIKWGQLIERYLHGSKQLKVVFLLIDIRHKPSGNDKMMYEWIVSQGFNPVIIATKLDKIKRSQKDKQIKIVKEGLGVLPGTVVIPFSSVTKQGRDEIWELVESQFLNV